MLRKIAVTLLPSVVVVGVLSSRGALANIYQCDNDRAPAQYPNCTNTLSAGWTYRSGMASDANGDDRLSGNGVRTSYFWNFSGLTGGNSLRLDAYLANIAFDDTMAFYVIWPTPNEGWASFFDQNSASNGWHFIVDTLPVPSVASPRVELSPSAVSSRNAGADVIQLSTFNGLSARVVAAVSPESCGASAIRDAKLLAIQQRMLNAVDNYQDVSGRYDVFFQNNGRDDSVEFAASQRQPGSHVVITDRAGQTSEYTSDGKDLAAKDSIGQPATRAHLAVAAPPVGPRDYYNESCEPTYVYRQDPAGAQAASAVLLPQNYAFWLSSSQAEITGTDIVAGRRATVIVGRQDPFLEAKLGATTFQLWVDDATGTLLKLRGTDRNGAIVYAIEVTEIHFDHGVDVSRFAIP